ncbi:MAG: hypothetical protein AAFQ58_19085 [Pseudomonadota bacterium]
MMQLRARWEGGMLRVLANHQLDLDEGELCLIDLDRARSGNTHRHQFAWVKEAWLNLPEDKVNMPWAETPETMRKHALIATGFHDTYTLDCGEHLTARKLKAALLAAEVRAHGYAVGQVKGTALTIWTPKSQSHRQMGRDQFQASKSAILDWISAQLGVEPKELERSSAA